MKRSRIIALALASAVIACVASPQVWDFLTLVTVEEEERFIGTRIGEKRRWATHEFDPFIGPIEISAYDGQILFQGRKNAKGREEGYCRLWDSDGSVIAIGVFRDGVMCCGGSQYERTKAGKQIRTQTVALKGSCVSNDQPPWWTADDFEASADACDHNDVSE